MRPIIAYEKPPLHPQMCMKCRCGDNGVREYFVDLGFDTEWEGAVYLCNDCITAVGVACGAFIPKDLYQATYDRLTEQIDFLLAQTRQITEWEILFDEFMHKDIYEFFETMKWVKDVRDNGVDLVTGINDSTVNVDDGTDGTSDSGTESSNILTIPKITIDDFRQ